MPPPRGVVCQICGKKCLKSSVKIHEKACKEKFHKSHSECRVCTAMVGNNEWMDHKSFCKGAGPLTKEEKQQRARVQARVAQANRQDEKREDPGGYSNAAAAYDPDAPIPTCKTAAPTGGNGMEAMMEKLRLLEMENARLKGEEPPNTTCPVAAPSGYETSVDPNSMYAAGDPRIACKVCSRKFNPDRYTAHMRVCTKLANKRKRKVWRGDKTRLEGTDFNTVRRTGTPPEVLEYRKKSKWRQQTRHAGDYMDERLKRVLSGVESKVDVAAEKVNARSSATLKKFLKERKKQVKELKEVKELNAGEFTTRESTANNSARPPKGARKSVAPKRSPSPQLRNSRQRRPRKASPVSSVARSAASSGAPSSRRSPATTSSKRVAIPRDLPSDDSVERTKPKFGRRASRERAAAGRRGSGPVAANRNANAARRRGPAAPVAANRSANAARRRGSAGNPGLSVSNSRAQPQPSKPKPAPKRQASAAAQRMVEARKAASARSRQSVKGVRHTKRNQMRDCIVPGSKPKSRAGIKRTPQERRQAAQRNSRAKPAPAAAEPFAMDVDLNGFKSRGSGIAPKGLGARSRDNEARKENIGPSTRGSDGRARVTGGVIKQSRGDDLLAIGTVTGAAKPSSMEEYRQREAARRKNRGALASRTNVPKPTKRASPAPAKKMGRKQMRTATNFAPTKASGHETIARPRDEKDLSDRRAAYFERMMGGM